MTAVNTLYLGVGFFIGALLGALAMGLMLMTRDDVDHETNAADKAYDDYVNSIVPRQGDHDHDHRGDEKFRR